MRSYRKVFWAGLVARLLCIPFLLQWFHADERQMLEFAHFHAHGRLHPFLESQLHLRNQSLPWFFSYLIRLCDYWQVSSPWAYLIVIQTAIACWTGWGFWSLLKVADLEGSPRITEKLGWFFALFWGFSFLYSRPLLEAASFAPACFLLLAVRRKQAFRAGLWAGIAGILRYPSIFWAAGALVLWFWQSRKFHFQPILRGVSGFVLAIILGGLADAATYGQFLESAPAYWFFNRPGGPVAEFFGNDSLLVYWKWFAFLWTPWGAAVFLLLLVWALIEIPWMGIFCLPYLAAHFWTPHREPRFMLPLTPFLALAIALLWQKGAVDRVIFKIRERPSLFLWGKRLLIGHLILNFIWYPLQFWAQWNSAQGVLLRHASQMAHEARDLVSLSEPVIDAWIPASVRWGDGQCRWHRPESVTPDPENKGPHELWVLSREPLVGCRSLDPVQPLPDRVTLAERLFRVRFAQLWSCPAQFLSSACPKGWLPAPRGEPLLGVHALRKEKNET